LSSYRSQRTGKSAAISGVASADLTRWPASEMALHVPADNLACVMNIMGIQPLMAAIRA
jgi:hypothetical protein